MPDVSTAEEYGNIFAAAGLQLDCQMFNSSSLLKVICDGQQKTESTQKTTLSSTTDASLRHPALRGNGVGGGLGLYYLLSE